MELICTNCGATINPQDIDIATDVANCRACNTTLRASLLSERDSFADMMVRPPNAKLQMQRGYNDSIELILPAKGMYGGGIKVVAFGLVWLGIAALCVVIFKDVPFFSFIVAITFSITAALFVNLGINDMFENQKVTVTDHDITIEKNRPINSRAVTVSRSDITEVKFADTLFAGPWASIAKMSRQNYGPARSLRENPAVVTATKTHFFFEGLSQKEQEWVVRLLKKVLMGK
jgi:hypothetical protein